MSFKITIGLNSNIRKTRRLNNINKSMEGPLHVVGNIKNTAVGNADLMRV